MARAANYFGRTPLGQTWLLRGHDYFVQTTQLFGGAMALLLVRVLLAYEYFQSGWEKYTGDNWFGDLVASGSFPFPFSVIPADVSWFLATWLELGGAALLVLGFGVRYISVALLVLTWVAAWSVHFPTEWHGWSQFWQDGYNVCDNGFKLPLFYAVLYLVLLGQGAGLLSVDAVVARYVRQKNEKVTNM